MTEDMLHCRVEGSGPKLALLHPVGLDLTCWDDVAALLARDYTVLRIDLRGHGKSFAAVAGSTLEDYADDVHTLLHAHGHAPAIVVGLSFGGMVTQTLAIRHPADVAAAVISACPSTLPDAAREMMRQRAALAEQNGMASLVEETLQRWFTPDFIARGGAERTRARLLADDPAGWATAWRAISQLDTKPRLGEIKVPALCIAGALDPAAPPAALEAIASGITGAERQVIPTGPHMMQIETPTLFTEAVTGFLSRRGLTGRA